MASLRSNPSRLASVRLARWCRAPFEWAGFYLCLLVLGLIQLGWALVASGLRLLLPKAAGRQLGRWVISQAFRNFFRLTAALGLLKVDATALDAIDQREAMIIAPNHPSVLDALILISRLDRLTCIMKASVLDNLLLGASARLAGYIRNDGAFRMLRLASADLKAGEQLIIFPEGTRTVSAPVNQFTRGFAAIARAARVPVQTVIIETDTPYLSKGWSVLRKPARLPMTFRVRLGERFEVGQDINGFVRALRAYFICELGDVERSGPWLAPEEQSPRLASRLGPSFKEQAGPIALSKALNAARPEAMAIGDRPPRP